MSKKVSSDKKIEEMRKRKEQNGNSFEIVNTMLSEAGSDVRVSEDEFQWVNIEDLEEAPPEMNFYRRLPEEKMFELIESVGKVGVLQPIIIWEREEAKSMILSGHNRTKALWHLFEFTGDEKFLNVPAIVKKDLDKDTAQEIIIDTNLVQRDLSPKEKIVSIYKKYVRLRQDKRYGDGSTRKKLAKNFSLGERTVSDYIKLNDLIEPFMDIVEEGKLSIKNAVKIAKEPSEKQWEFYNKFQDKLSNSLLNSVKDIKDINELNNTQDVFQKEEEEDIEALEYISIELNVPAKYEKEFRRLYREWIKEKINPNSTEPTDENITHLYKEDEQSG